MSSGGNPDLGAWGIECLERALQLNPKAVLAHSQLLYLRQYAQRAPLYQVAPSERYDRIAELPDAKRLSALPGAALSSLSNIRSLSSENDRNLQELIDLYRRDARRFAHDMLTLAPSQRSHPAHGRAVFVANMTLGALALEEGNRSAALAHLRKASEAPASEELIYSNYLVLGGHLGPSLAADLLKLGERDAVIDFLERMARVNLAQRVAIRSALAAIRRGETPTLRG
jgi:hypothetical protein